ncbi:hypothetical protein QZH45_14290 [Pseudomonas corrugata]|uniref:hypothetical protein n=1 Tax=Pseudomonas corrugata TaxID=47879 RepID=UPI003D814F2F
MNFEQAKALRIQQWRDTLDDHDFRMQNPEAHRSCLLAASARLAEERLIDRAEKFDMDEMANSAYWHAVEELQSTTALYHGASHYELMSRDGLPSLGTIRQSTFTDKTESQRIHAYDGQVYRQGGELTLICRAAPNGVIEGLVLTLDDGRRFDLVETARMIRGVVYKPIEDPDVYRWLVDAVLIAHENRNLVLMEKLRPFLELARFAQCPSCLDGFGERDSCTYCNGLGFIKRIPPRPMR